MKKGNYILSFIAYVPRVYSALDRFDLLLAKKLVVEGYKPVFVFCDTMADMPAIQTDLEGAGAIVELIPSRGKWMQMKAVWRLYKQYHPTIVHTHFVNYLKLITLFLSSWYGVKHYTTFHSMIAGVSVEEYRKQKGLIKSYGLRTFLRLISKLSEQVFAVSLLNYKHYCAFCSNTPSNLHCLYLGVSTTISRYTKEQVRLMLGLPQDAIVLCNISAKESLKCIDVLLQAVAFLKKKCPEQEILFAHIGGLRADNEENRAYEQSLYAMADELGVTDRVVWLGRRNDIADIMPAFDIYVHPSRFEGLPTVLMEAAQASLPMVGSKAGGIPEFVRDGVNGYLCEVNNVTDLAEKIGRLIEDEFLCKQMGEESRKLLLQEFDVVQQTDKLLNYYLV